jgi:hypothetical protein
MNSYDNYKKKIIEDIYDCIEKMQCQPILFIGSGLSIRYFDAPNWDSLLEKMIKICPNITRSFQYYKQSNTNEKIGEILANLFKDWAWDSGQEQFPKELFNYTKNYDVYIKYKIAELLKNITPNSLSEIKNEILIEELELLKAIQPHAIITTNYDTFLEKIFTDYVTVVGQSIIKSNHSSIGEIFKIHGCVSKPEDIVFTEQDYKIFMKQKKYLSAKLLTYFLEHPLIFIGYSATDHNIRSILEDIDEIISSSDNLIENIYFVDWNPDISSSNEKYYPYDKFIKVSDTKTVRVKNIVTDNFNWVFEALSKNKALNKVNVKLLRSLMARTYKMIRTDIPSKTIEVSYKHLEGVISNNENFTDIFGITTIGLQDPIALNATYPYTITQIAQKFDDTVKNSHSMLVLIKKIQEEKNIDIKATDNKYHLSIKTGSNNNSRTHKYSEFAYELLKKVKNGEEYEVEITTEMK